MQLRILSLLADWYGFFVTLLAGGVRTILQKYYNLLLDPLETSVPWGTSGALHFLVCVSLSSSVTWHSLSENPYDVITREINELGAVPSRGPVDELWSQTLVQNLVWFF